MFNQHTVNTEISKKLETQIRINTRLQKRVDKLEKKIIFLAEKISLIKYNHIKFENINERLDTMFKWFTFLKSRLNAIEKVVNLEGGDFIGDASVVQRLLALEAAIFTKQDSTKNEAK